MKEEKWLHNSPCNRDYKTLIMSMSFLDHKLQRKQAGPNYSSGHHCKSFVLEHECVTSCMYERERLAFRHNSGSF